MARTNLFIGVKLLELVILQQSWQNARSIEILWPPTAAAFALQYKRIIMLKYHALQHVKPLPCFIDMYTNDTNFYNSYKTQSPLEVAFKKRKVYIGLFDSCVCFMIEP
jgi:hypothetical protein